MNGGYHLVPEDTIYGSYDHDFDLGYDFEIWILNFKLNSI